MSPKYPEMPSIINITMADYYPATSYKDHCKPPQFRPSTLCQRPGLANEIMNLLAEELDIKIESNLIRRPIDNNQKFDMVYGDLLHNRTDLYMLMFQETELRKDNFTFTSALYDLTVMQDYPMTNFECKRVPTFRASDSCQRPGLAVEIIKLIADHLNLTIKPKIKLMPRGSEHENAYKYMFEEMMKNKTDLYASFFSRTQLRESNYSFTKSVYQSSTKIAVRRSDQSLKSIFDFFTVYNYQSWLLMVMMFLLFTAFGVFVRWVEWKLSLRKDWTPATLIYKMCRLQLIQPDPIDYKFMSGSISLITFTLLQIGVIVGIYESWVLSSVIKSKDEYPFRPEELFHVLESKKYFIVTPSVREWIFNELETSYLSPYYELREATKNNPIIETSDVDSALNMVQNQNAILFVPDDQYITFAAEKFCDFVYIDSPIPPNQERFMFRKGSPFIKPFNEAILANQVHIQRLYRKYIISRPPSNCTNINKFPKPLGITPYFGVLILFFVGISSACFVFSGEVMKFYSKRQTNRQIKREI